MTNAMDEHFHALNADLIYAAREGKNKAKKLSITII